MNTLRMTRLLNAVLVCFLLGTNATQAHDDPLIATVNAHEIRASYVNGQIAKMPLGDQVSVRANPSQFAESLIQEEVLFQYLLSSDFDGEIEIRDEMKTLVVNHLIDKHVTSRLTVTDEEVRAFYDDNISAIRGELVEVSQILSATQQDALALKQRVADGESFESLARAHSLHDPSAIKGGKLGSFMDHEGPLGFESEVLNMEPGDYDIFESSEGWHLVLVTERIIPALPPLDNVAPNIRALLRRQKEIDALRNLMDRAHQHVNVTRVE